MKKNIDLPQDVVDTLSIQAIQSGKKNFKNYVEWILEEASKEGSNVRILDPKREGVLYARKNVVKR